MLPGRTGLRSRIPAFRIGRPGRAPSVPRRKAVVGCCTDDEMLESFIQGLAGYYHCRLLAIPVGAWVVDGVTGWPTISETNL